MAPDTPQLLPAPAGAELPGDLAVRAFAESLHLSPEVADRLVGTERRLRAARSDNTLRALRADLGVWTAWCAAERRIALPARPGDVAAFVDAHAPVRAPATVRRYLASVAALHRAARLADPTKDEDVRLALAAAARSWAAACSAAGRPTRQRQAAGITERAVTHILASYPPGGPTRAIDRRDVALLLVARDLLARRSELVALRVDDLRPTADGGATIAIRRSKTDQAGEGRVGYLGPEAHDAVRAWLDAAGHAAGPLFRSVHATGRPGAALHPQKVPAILKKLAERAAPQLRRLGIRPDEVSGHSCRVGMAQDLVEAGLELPAIMQAGRWKTSAMVARYAERLLASQGAVAQYHARRRRP